MNDTAKISARGDRLFEGDEVIAEFAGWQAEQNAEKAATALRASAGGEPAIVTGVASAPADIVRFASEGRTVLVIRHDGRVDVAEGVEPGEAGRLAMAAMGEALARELAAAREEGRKEARASFLETPPPAMTRDVIDATLTAILSRSGFDAAKQLALVVADQERRLRALEIAAQVRA